MTNITTIQCEACLAPLSTTLHKGKIVLCDYCHTENVVSDDVKIVIANSSNKFRVKLYKAIANSFGSLDDLQHLIYILNGEIDDCVDYDNIAGSTTITKSLELVACCYRRNYLQELVDVCFALRPRMEI